jgi:hypothetical protein
MPYALKFLMVMVSVGLADVCYVYYFLSVTARRPFRAGLWSMAVLGLFANSTISYVGDNTLLIAALLGGFLGTYYSVRNDKAKPAA